MMNAGSHSPETTEMLSVFVVIFLFSQQHRRGSLQPEQHGVPRGPAEEHATHVTYVEINMAPPRCGLDLSPDIFCV